MLQLEEKEAELIEYQESSRELEQELQKQLELSENRNQELTAVNCRLQRDYEDLKSKLSRERQDLICKVEELSQELVAEKSHNKTLTEGIRNLEQMNDDLERSKRALAATLEDFETKFNSQIEKNVLLENELGEKSELEEVIQRLKDEARDLREELLVQQQKRISISESHTVTPSPQPLHHPPHHTPPNTVLPSNCHSKIHRPISKPNSIPVRNHFPPSPLNHNNHSNHLNNHMNNHSSRNNNNILNSLTKSPASPPASSPSSSAIRSPTTSPVKAASAGTNGPMTPTGRSSSGVMTNGTSNGQSSLVREPLPLLSPNTRNSALNIVSDLLRKVGDLESKLASCRNIVPQACRNSSEV